MGLIALSTDVVREYSIKEDTSEDKTIFLLGGIDSITRAYIDDKHMAQGSWDSIDIHDKFIDFVRFGLKGWRNFKDSSGNDVPFQAEEKTLPRLGKVTLASEASLKLLDLLWIVQLGNQVIENSALTDQDKKK